MHASYFDVRRHVVRLCYKCGMPDFENDGLTLACSCRIDPKSSSDVPIPVMAIYDSRLEWVDAAEC